MRGGQVTVHLACNATHALLRVCDTGTGIAPDDLPHLFERFYRADPSRSRQAGGTGLGLAIVRWVAEAHGGSVTVQSRPGQGSTFTLRVPLPTASMHHDGMQTSDEKHYSPG